MDTITSRSARKVIGRRLSFIPFNRGSTSLGAPAFAAMQATRTRTAHSIEPPGEPTEGKPISSAKTPIS